MPGRRFLGGLQFPYSPPEDRTTHRAFHNFDALLPCCEFFSDQRSCAMDAFNLAVGCQLLTRTGLGVSPDDLLSFVQPKSLRHGENAPTPPMKKAIESLRFGMLGLFTRVSKKIIYPPTMVQVLGFDSGVFLVEFFWRRKETNAQDWHVVAVNCDMRRVFCNTLGVIPFNNGLANEAEKTHLAVSAHLRVVSVMRVWRVLCRA